MRLTLIIPVLGELGKWVLTYGHLCSVLIEMLLQHGNQKPIQY